MFLIGNMHNRIISVLVPHMGQDARRAYVEAVLSDHPVIRRIDWTGPDYEFTSHLVSRINTHCDPDDMIRLLREVQQHVGTQQQAALEDIIAQLLPQPDPAPPPDVLAEQSN